MKDDLLEGAVLERTASFTLALDKAREKLEKFQLPDPRLYILQIVQAIIASGASRIEVRHELADLGVSYSLTLDFDGPGYTSSELKHLYDFLFESGRSREKDRTRELALGIVSCQALKPHKLLLRSGGWAWTRINNKETVTEVPAQSFHRFSVEGRGSGDEVKLLDSHCNNCEISITVNDRVISTAGRMARGSCPWPNYRFKHPEFQGALGIAYGDIERSSLTLLRYGVQFTRRFEARIRPPLVVECEHESLRKNASQSDVVEDRAYMQFLEQLSHVQLEFSLELAQQRVPAYHRDLVQKYLMRFFGAWFTPVLLTQRVQDLEPRMQKMLKLPLFTDIHGRRHPLAGLLDAYRRDDCLLYTSRRRPYTTLRDVLVLCPTEEELIVLESLFDRIVLADSDLESRVALIQARRRGLRLEPPKPLASHPDVSVHVPDEVPHNNVRWYFMQEGDWVFRELPIPGLGAVMIEAKNRADFEIASAEHELVRTLPFQLSDLYLRLLEKLLRARRSKKFLKTIARARDHAAQYLLWKLSKRHASSRQSIGENWWTGRFLETKSGQAVSLADIETWLETFPQLVLAAGGPQLDEDHALDASPLILKLLQATFGRERFLEATVEHQLLHERRAQAPLAGAADGPALKVQVEESEEEEMARLKREFLEARASAKKVAAAPAVAVEPVIAAEPEPEPEPKPESVSAELPADMQEFLHEFDLLPQTVSLSIQEKDCKGVLALVVEHAQSAIPVGNVVRFHNHEVVGRLAFPPYLPTGWVDSALDQEELIELLRPHLVQLYRRLGPALTHLNPAGPAATYWRPRLLTVLLRDPHLRRDGLLGEVPLFPLAGGSFASLRQVAEMADKFEQLVWCRPEDPDPSAPQPVLRLLNPVTPELLQDLFKCEVVRARLDRQLKPNEQLLQEIRSVLFRSVDPQRTGLDETIIHAVTWGEPTRWLGGPRKYFVNHHPDRGLTELNPGHSMLKKIIKSAKNHKRMAPVLASSVFTSINRALHEVEDGHELAFLEDLLEEI